MQHLYDVEN